MPNLTAAIAYLHHNEKPHPDGECAKHVRIALDAAGFDTTGHPDAAKLYGPFLERLGFTAVANDLPHEVGDVRVWQGPASDPFGHVAMWTGSAWLADFAMKTEWPSSHDVGTPVATYRFPSAA